MNRRDCNSDFPLDWIAKTCGELAPLQRGYDLPDKNLINGMFPVVYSNGILNYHNTFKIKGPGVVTGRSGTIGSVFYINDDYWPHNTTLYVTDFNNNYPKFIYYLYTFLNLKQYSAGSGVPTLNRNDIHELKIIIPTSIQEQSAIAEALSDADNFIETLEQTIAKKRLIKQGIMTELLTGKRRLPPFDKQMSKKQTEIGEIPEDWKIVPLANLCKGIYRGASPRPISDPMWFDENSLIGWVRISDVSSSHKFLTQTAQHISKAGLVNSRFVKSPTVIMSICATIGKPIITTIDVCIHDGFVEFHSPKIDYTFLYYILENIEPDWTTKGQTGSQMNLNTDIINNTLIVLPSSSKEQTAIAEVLSDIDADIEALEEKLAKARQIKAGMMAELLTGRIRLV